MMEKIKDGNYLYLSLLEGEVKKTICHMFE